MKPQTTQNAFDLFHALRFMRMADLYLSSVINDKNTSGTAKQMLITMRNRLDVNIRDLRLRVTPQNREIIDRDMLDPNVALQFQNINNMLAELNQDNRDTVENFIENIFNNKTI